MEASVQALKTRVSGKLRGSWPPTGEPLRCPPSSGPEGPSLGWEELHRALLACLPARFQADAVGLSPRLQQAWDASGFAWEVMVPLWSRLKRGGRSAPGSLCRGIQEPPSPGGETGRPGMAQTAGATRGAVRGVPFLWPQPGQPARTASPSLLGGRGLRDFLRASENRFAGL